MNKLQDRLLRAYIRGNAELKNFISQDDGDTNFISIAIILVVVLGIAVVFIQFGSTVADKLREAITEITDEW